MGVLKNILMSWGAPPTNDIRMSGCGSQVMSMSSKAWEPFLALDCPSVSEPPTLSCTTIFVFLLQVPSGHGSCLSFWNSFLQSSSGIIYSLLPIYLISRCKYFKTLVLPRSPALFGLALIN